ncbi:MULTISPECIES: hypothetical protein [Paenibacillus]|uniref:Holin-like toxin n=1 Tax=Paenibacillus albilobatus TaxID=2716884 RepID=A0A919XF38_9BACL|nr:MULTISPECIES: hypothetical protein [Paenibacillus]MDR9853967.1 hypothetical protein [Paenibacillus sp. VCA1]GIO31021.1 hypothetical protein J2TS6_21620 [Paenibacillus albilobatus]
MGKRKEAFHGSKEPSGRAILSAGRRTAMTIDQLIALLTLVVMIITLAVNHEKPKQ